MATIAVLGAGNGGCAAAGDLARRGHAVRLYSRSPATLTYCTRLVEPATVDVFRVAPRLPFAAFPGRDTAALLAALRPLYPALAPAASVLETALMDINAVEHPPQALCNAGWIEATAGDFYFYYQGTSPAVARAIEALDAERLGLVRALGFEP